MNPKTIKYTFDLIIIQKVSQFRKESSSHCFYDPWKRKKKTFSTFCDVFKGYRNGQIDWKRHYKIIDKFVIIHRGWMKNNFYCIKSFWYIIWYIKKALDVSYDVESLFTNIPTQETIEVDVNLVETDFQKIIDKTCYRMYF